MVHFELSRERAYVVPALRHSQAAQPPWYAAKKSLILIVSAVILAHLILAWILFMYWVSTQTAPEANVQPSSMEAVVVFEEARNHLSAEKQRSIPNLTPAAHRNEQQLGKTTPIHQSATVLIKPAKNTSHTNQTSYSEPIKNQATLHTKDTDTQANASQSSSANHAPVSNQTCSVFASFNRRYPSPVSGNSTVTLTLTRNAQGTVTGATLLKSSGNAGLDQFALQSARNARFVSHPECGNRSFHLPIKFSTKTA